MPKPSTEQLQKINQFTQVPLTEDNCVVFSNLMIDDQITAYSSKIHPNLLNKFLEDTRRGVGLLTNHNNRQLPVGRSFDATIRNETDSNGRQMTSLHGQFYIDLGRNTQGGMSTDDIAKGIDAGTIFDTSIGFNSHKWDCSICNNDIRDWMKCSHVPGKKYAVTRDGADVVETCLVIAGADGNGELLENSLVYAGACNRATITKGNFSTPDVSDTENGTKLHLVEDFKDIPLDTVIYQYYTNDGSVLFTDTDERTNGSQELRKRSEQQMELEKLLAVLGKFSVAVDTPEAVEAALQALVDAQGSLAAKETELQGVNEQLTQANEQLAQATAKTGELEGQLSEKTAAISALELANQDLTEKAGVAETYRQDLITKTNEMGVRLMGNSFNVELYTKFLGTLSLDEIKGQFGSFETQVQEKFGGARITNGDAERRKADGGELFREDFETDTEYGNYVADKATEYAKAEGVSISEATRLMYKKYSKKESE